MASCESTPVEGLQKAVKVRPRRSRAPASPRAIPPARLPALRFLTSPALAFAAPCAPLQGFMGPILTAGTPEAVANAARWLLTEGCYPVIFLLAAEARWASLVGALVREDQRRAHLTDADGRTTLEIAGRECREAIYEARPGRRRSPSQPARPLSKAKLPPPPPPVATDP